LVVVAIAGRRWLAMKKDKKWTPAGRHSHTAVVWGKSMFVFGGVTQGNRATNQLLQFNFHTLFVG